MNLFIDTNILYSDPLFETFLGELILDRANKNFVKIFLSEVVLMELKKNYLDRTSKAISELTSKAENYSRLTKDKIEMKLSSIEELEKSFNEFYKKPY